MIFLLLAGSLFLNIQLSGQGFVMVSNTLPDLGRSAVTWGDFDLDGDLDLFVSGLGPDDEPYSAIYRNEEGELTLYLELQGYKECSAEWGDMDNDGDLDLLLAGNTDEGDKTRIFRNDDGDFTEIDPQMLNVSAGDVSWMDVDGDGDLDAFVSGNWNAAVYVNRDGVFQLLWDDFGLYSSSAADWGDFDNDGDLDLLLNGDSGAGAVTDIFRNDNNVFTKLEDNLTGLMAGSVDWVDYDLDGDLDISISGNDDALEAQCFIYRNDGDGEFTLLQQTLEGFSLGDAFWGDFDNDGDPDMLYSGKCTGCGVNVSGINRNEGDDEFLPMTDLFVRLMRCSLQAADFDNDGDLDFVLAGTSLSGTPATYLYKNADGSNTYHVNTAPTIPGGLLSEVIDNNVALSWDLSTDDHTAQAALSYNIRMGMTSEGCEIMPPMAAPADGFRKVPGNGNTGQNITWEIDDLQPGTYYWSVQAIDQAFLGSAFAPEQTFTLTAIGLDDISKTNNVRIYPNPANLTVSISGGSIDSETEIMILDLTGRCHLRQKITPTNSMVDVSSLMPGLYLIELLGGNTHITEKLLVE
jgi:hypothetical protein